MIFWRHAGKDTAKTIASVDTPHRNAVRFNFAHDRNSLRHLDGARRRIPGTRRPLARSMALVLGHRVSRTHRNSSIRALARLVHRRRAGRDARSREFRVTFSRFASERSRRAIY